MNSETKKLRIAYVSDAIYPYNKGGKEKRLYDISTRLGNQGHNVTIFCMNWWKGERERIEDGVTLHAISPYYPLYAGNRRSIKQGILFGFCCLKLFAKDWDVLDVDHIPYFPLFSCKLVCLLKRKKMIATWHEVWGKTYWQQYLGRYAGIVAFVIELLTFVLPDRIIAVSESTANKLAQYTAKPKIETVPLGVDIGFIESIGPSARISDIIFVGRLLPHKNVDLLIRALAEVRADKPCVTCFIIGDGPEKDNLVNLCKYLNLENNVTIIDDVQNQSDVYAMMKSSKAFVSLSEREGFGIAVLEANACGLPVILANSENNASVRLLNKGNGESLSLNSDAIGKCILKYLNPSVNSRDSIKSGALIYDWKYRLKTLCDIYAGMARR